jgi:hypothetical protein
VRFRTVGHTTADSNEAISIAVFVYARADSWLSKLDFSWAYADVVKSCALVNAKVFRRAFDSGNGFIISLDQKAVIVGACLALVLTTSSQPSKTLDDATEHLVSSRLLPSTAILKSMAPLEPFDCYKVFHEVIVSAASLASTPRNDGECAAWVTVQLRLAHLIHALELQIKCTGAMAQSFIITLDQGTVTKDRVKVSALLRSFAETWSSVTEKVSARVH